MYRAKKKKGGIAPNKSPYHTPSSHRSCCEMCIYGHVFQPDHQTLKPVVSDKVTRVEWLHFAIGESC